MSDDLSKIHFKATRKEMKEARAAFDSNHDGIVTIEEVAKNTQKALDVFKKNIELTEEFNHETPAQKQRAINEIAEIALIKSAQKFGVDLTSEKLIKQVEDVQGHKNTADNLGITPFYTFMKLAGFDFNDDANVKHGNHVLATTHHEKKVSPVPASGDNKTHVKLDFVDVGANGSLVGNASTTPKEKGVLTPSTYLT